MVPPQIKALFFDVLGTCVAQIPPVADELQKATRDALQSTSIDNNIREVAEKMTYDHWTDFAIEWNKSADTLVAADKAKDAVDWRRVDQYLVDCLTKLLAQKNLITLESTTPSANNIAPGSLFTTSQVKSLSSVWHRLAPYPDTIRGISLLNKRYKTCALSNTYQDMMENLCAVNKLPFQHIMTSELFQSFKPNPKVYLGAAERVGVKPEECALVAAHLPDLRGAKACGFYSIYVERELEEKKPELIGTGVEDLRIGIGQDGFVELAKQLGISID